MSGKSYFSNTSGWICQEDRIFLTYRDGYVRETAFFQHIGVDMSGKSPFLNISGWICQEDRVFLTYRGEYVSDLAD